MAKTLAEVLTANPLLDEPNDKVLAFLSSPSEKELPWRFVEGREYGDGKWYWIHDFFHGFGWRKVDDMGEEYVVWTGDVTTFLPEVAKKYGKGCDPPVTTQELNEIWCRLQPRIEGRQRRAWQRYKLGPPQFTSIKIPLVRREYPVL